MFCTASLSETDSQTVLSTVDLPVTCSSENSTNVKMVNPPSTHASNISLDVSQEKNVPGVISDKVKLCVSLARTPLLAESGRVDGSRAASSFCRHTEHCVKTAQQIHCARRFHLQSLDCQHLRTIPCQHCSGIHREQIS